MNVQATDYEKENWYSEDDAEGKEDEEEVKSLGKLLFWCNCRWIGHLSSRCSYEISKERDRYTYSSDEGHILMAIEDQHIIKKIKSN